MSSGQKRPQSATVPGNNQEDPEPGLFARPSFFRIAPFALYLAFLAINDALLRLGWDAGDLRWLYPIRIGLVALMLLAFRRAYSELAWRTLSLPSAAAACVTGIVVFVLWIALDARWMLIGESAGFNPMVDGQLDWLLITLRIAGAALVVPVMEELFWRSFLLRWLQQQRFLELYPAQVGLRALMIAALLFGVEHNQWLAGIIAGLAYSFLYMRTGNLWSAILSHCVTNALLGVWIVSTSSWTYW